MVFTDGRGDAGACATFDGLSFCNPNLISKQSKDLSSNFQVIERARVNFQATERAKVKFQAISARSTERAMTEV